MKELDIRERVQAFLKNTVRLVVVPASMGIGLALIGCSDSPEETRQDGGAEVATMAGQSGHGGSAGVSGSAGGSSSGGSGGFATVYAAFVFDAGAGGAPLVCPYAALIRLWPYGITSVLTPYATTGYEPPPLGFTYHFPVEPT